MALSLQSAKLAAWNLGERLAREERAGDGQAAEKTRNAFHALLRQLGRIGPRDRFGRLMPQETRELEFAFADGAWHTKYGY